MTIIRPTTINARFSQPVGLGGEKLWLCPTLGGDRLDLSGNGNHGTYEGGMGTVADKYKGDRAYKFDGSNDRINFGDILDETVWTSGKWTISEWVYPQHSTYNFLLCKSNFSNNQRQFLTSARDIGSGLKANVTIYGTLVAQAYRAFQGDTVLSLNEWYHLFFEYDSSKSSNNQVRIFVNGIKQNLNITSSSGTVGNIQNGSESLLINGLLDFNPTFTNPYRFDDVRVYDRHLTPTEIKHLASKRGVLGSPRQPYDPLKRTVVRVPAAIQAATVVGSIKKPTTIIKPSYQAGYARNASESENPNLWDGLVGAWMPSLGVTGETLRDVSGNGNHGTLTGMDAATDWVATSKGLALDFDGTGGNIVSLPEAFSLGGFHSFSTTIRFDAFNSVVAGGGSSNHYLLYVANANTLYYRDNNGFSIISTTANLEIGKQHHIAVTRKNTTVKSFVDGVFKGSGQRFGTAIINTIGGYPNTAASVNGQISSASIYNRALSPSEIKQLYVDSLAPFRKKQRVSVAVPAAVAPSATYHPLRSLAHPLEQ